MNKIPYILFATVFFINFLTFKLSLLPRIFIWTPELISVVVTIIIILRISYTRYICISPKYIVLFVLFMMHIISGVLINAVPEGAILAGLRYYIKFSPFFLIPVVYNFSDDQMSRQMKVLLILGLIQMPLSIIQRTVLYRHLATGDVVTGTLGVSSVLSIVLVCSIVILLAFYLRKRISGEKMLLLSLLLFIPATINETKGTIILLPLGLLTVLLFLADNSEARKKIIGVISVVAVLGVIFVSIYDHFYARDSSGGILDFFSGKYLEHYLYRGAEFDPTLLQPRKGSLLSKNIQEVAPPARIDRALAPIIMLSTDPMKLYFGLGIGNASRFRFGDLSGDYAHLSYLMGSENSMFSLIFWEIGLGGFFLYMAFFYMIFSDARKLGKQHNLSGDIAAGWVGVITIMVISLPYKNIMGFNVVGFLFMYLSGYVASKQHQHTRVQAAKFTTLPYVRYAKKAKHNQ